MKKKTPEKNSKKPAAAPQLAKKAEKKVSASKAAKPAKAAPHKAPAPAKAKPAKAVAAKNAKGQKAKEEFLIEESDEILESTDAYEEELNEIEQDLAEDEAGVEASDDDDDDDGDEAVVEASSEEDIVLTDAEGNRYCRARDCDQIAAVDTYCRFHYLLFWKRIQVRKEILQDGKLERYVEELTSRYPDKFLEMIRRDLRTEKDFLGAIQELEIDESGLDNEYEEDTQSFIDEVRGMGEGASETVEDDF